MQHTGKGKKKGVILLVVGLAIIAVLAGVIIYLLMRNKTEDEPSLRGVVINEQNAEQVVSQMNEIATEFVEPGYFTISMNNVWHFAKGESSSYDAFVENLPENTNDVYFNVYIEGAEAEGDEIYESPVIPLGSRLDQIIMDERLDPGTYPCVMEYHLVDKNQNTISTLNVAIQLVFE
jgi:hypothetical protein